MKMKKILSLMIAAVMVFSCAAGAFAADDKQAVIFVPGFAETNIRIYSEDGSSQKYYMPVVREVQADYSPLVKGILKALFLFSYNDLLDEMVRLGNISCDNLVCDDNGVPVYDNVRPGVSGYEQCSYPRLREHGWDDVDHGAQFAEDIAQRIGADNVYVFGYDWRLGSATLADQLAEFIGGVKRVTGARTVHFYANSYGCQILARYFDEYGDEGVGRVVFSSPAWAGTELTSALFNEDLSNVDLDLISGYRFFLRLMGWELDIDWVMKLIPARISKRLLRTLANDVIAVRLNTWPSLLCMCPAEDYEALKGRFLDPVKNAAIIEECDDIQYGVKTHIPELLSKLETDGVKVSIVAGSGSQIISGHKVDGDCVIDVKNAVGAQVLPVGEKLDKTGDTVSPSGNIDMSGAYLPERTWIVNGMTHGQTHWDKNVRELVLSLLLSDEITDVNSDPRYPRFMDTACPGSDLSVRIGDGGSMTLAPSQGKVEAVITNESAENTMKIRGVSVCGVKYIASPVFTTLAPGESLTVTLTPIVNKPGEYGTISINYVKSAYMPLLKTREVPVKTVE